MAVAAQVFGTHKSPLTCVDSQPTLTSILQHPRRVPDHPDHNTYGVLDSAHPIPMHLYGRAQTKGMKSITDLHRSRCSCEVDRGKRELYGLRWSYPQRQITATWPCFSQPSHDKVITRVNVVTRLGVGARSSGQATLGLGRGVWLAAQTTKTPNNKLDLEGSKTSLTST